MNAPIDPMSQYDPATEALIMRQMSPQHKVANAMMQQGGGSGMGPLIGPLMQLAMTYGKGAPPTAGGPGTIPVTTPGLKTNFNNFGMGGPGSMQPGGG